MLIYLFHSVEIVEIPGRHTGTRSFPFVYNVVQYSVDSSRCKETQHSSRLTNNVLHNEQDLLRHLKTLQGMNWPLVYPIWNTEIAFADNELKRRNQQETNAIF